MASKITITINGKEVETREGKNVLDAALDAGIYIPHLCHHPDLTPFASCKLCIVEHNGKIKSSCTLKAEQGMSINTQNDKITKDRRMAMELILAAHPEDCSTCTKYGNCELQTLIQYLGVSGEGHYHRNKDFVLDGKNPLFDNDFYRCVLCGRCVRVCEQVRGVKVLDYLKKDDEVYAGVPLGENLMDNDCRFCGACIEVCPTGAIMDKASFIDKSKTKEENLVPCRNTCPAGTNIPKYIRLINEGKIEESNAVIREKLPLPGILGHICSHPCESECRRAGINDPIDIKNLKLYAVENDKNNVWKKKRKMLPETGKEVAIVGAGPAGLTAAYYLKKQGHKVTILEALGVGGGMPMIGIPAYRLPNNVIEEEIADIQDIGVNIEYNKKVEDYIELKDKYNAVLVAIGAHRGVRLPIKGNELNGVYTNISFLQGAALGQAISLGEKVLILGGGNVAFDCARTAVRLGNGQVHIACLEDADTIPADLEEIEAAKEEDIIIHYKKSFIEIIGDKGKVTGIKMRDVDTMTIDPSKGMKINTIEGSDHTMEFDTIIFATGQRPDILESNGLDLKRGNLIRVNENQSTNVEGIFAAGDCIYGTQSVIKALASGRTAASEIDKYLGGDGDIEESLVEKEENNPYIGRIEGFGKLPRKSVGKRDGRDRVNDFERVERTFTCEQAQYESTRCLQCDLRMDIESPRTWNQYEG